MVASNTKCEMKTQKKKQEWRFFYPYSVPQIISVTSNGAQHRNWICNSGLISYLNSSSVYQLVTIILMSHSEYIISDVISTIISTAFVLEYKLNGVWSINNLVDFTCTLICELPKKKKKKTHTKHITEQVDRFCHHQQH